MVFQRPNPFPNLSIYDNVIAGYKLNGIKLAKADKDRIVEHSLTRVALWNEVKDSLNKKGSFLSAASSNAFASPGPWPWSRKFCSSMSPHRPWTLSPLHGGRALP